MTESQTIPVPALGRTASFLYQGVPRPSPTGQDTETQDYAGNRYGLCLTRDEAHYVRDRVRSVKPDDIRRLEIPVDLESPPSTEWTDENPMVRVAGFVMSGLDIRVVDFALQRNVVSYLPVVRNLVKDCFLGVGKVEFEMETDPDTGERWISVNAQVSGDPEAVVDEYRCFVHRWMARAPEQVRDAVRLFYYLD